MMKNRWKQRGMALMAVLALAVPAAGMTTDVLDAAELYEPQVYAEAVDQVAEQEEADLPVEPDDPTMYDPLVYPEYADPDFIAPADGDDIWVDETVVPEDPVTGEPQAENVPESAEKAGDEAAPEVTDSAEGKAAPVGAESAAEEGAEVKTEGEIADENTEKAPEGETAEGAEKPTEGEPVEGAEKTSEGETAADAEKPAEGETAEGTEKPAEGEATGEKTGEADGDADAGTKEKAEGEAADEASGEAETKPAAEASEIVAVEAEAAPKAVAEAAPTLSFPTSNLFMGRGEHTTLTAQLANAPGVTVSYASDKKKIVTVDAAGNLHARKKGVATITATASNGMTASCTVKVVKAPSKVKLGRKKLIFGVGEVRTLSAKLPKGSASAITWVSANPAVVAVDAAGNLQGVSPGKAKVTARTFNGKRATCTVTILGGLTPTKLTFPSATIKMGNKEKRKLQPQLGAGEAAIFTYSSSNKRVVSVNGNGMMKAKKKGTARITVKTHNGLKFRLTVKVVKAPGKLTLSKKNFTMRAGEALTVKTTLPSGTASAITWTSSDPNVAAVDAAGTVVAISPGTVTLTAKTYNGKSATCTLTVTTGDPRNTPPALTNAQMAANLRASTALGSKRQNLGDVAQLLMDNGFSPAFAAGVVANIYSEGSYGKLESSNYGITSGNVDLQHKRPKYFCYLDGGIYYTKDANGNYVPAIQFVPPEIKAAHPDDPAYLVRYGDENYYLNNWSSKYIYDGCDLNALQVFIDNLTNNVRQDGVSYSHDWKDGKMWHGKFGMGCTQWTGGRTRKLMALYRKYAGAGSATITKAQTIAAEHEMILYDLTGDYKKVYTEWLNTNENAKYCPEAAYSAGSLVCLKYEIPANKESSAVKRGNNASKFYKIMVGEA